MSRGVDTAPGRVPEAMREVRVGLLELAEKEVTVKIRNWTKFQHYKHRKPPWLKLYRELLEDPEWMAQSDGAKALLLELWMVASDTDDGSLPSIDALAWRLRRASNVLAETLTFINHKFIEGASEVLAGRLQDAIPEKSREELQSRGEERQSGSASGQLSVNIRQQTSTDLSTGNGHDIDEERADIDREEIRLLKTLVCLQGSGVDVQAVCDSLERPKGQPAFAAHRALVGGKSGIPRTAAGLVVRQRLNDALEARQRAQEAPYVSEKNRISFDSIDRVLGTGDFAGKAIGGSK